MAIGLIWFRQDLRLADNPALSEALVCCQKILPVFIYSTVENHPNEPGAASRWWLHHSLKALDCQLRRLNSRLIVRTGQSLAALKQLLRETGANHVFWNRVYEPALIERDRKIKEHLSQRGVTCVSFNSALLQEPWEVLTKNKRAFRVFTPFWKAHQLSYQSVPPLPTPEILPSSSNTIVSLDIDDLQLLPTIPWDKGIAATWQPGEDSAQIRLQRFLDGVVQDYATARERPDQPGSSRLSPHLHFGEISPKQILAAVTNYVQVNKQAGILKNAETFIKQLGWREFAYHQLFHFPHTIEQPLDERFITFPWQSDYSSQLKAWQRGRTGFPIIDAGMRELWHTGWMHNRVRMLVASLLTKNLRIPWREGERWFWDTLVDADRANNVLGWQWTAGCGADAAPYFRIFNPVTQGERHDPNGDYVRRWIPELTELPAKFIHKPWAAPSTILDDCGIRLGDTYPYPIIDLRQSRQQALAMYDSIKRASTSSPKDSKTMPHTGLST